MTPAKILVVDDEIELERLLKQRFRKKIAAKELDFIFAHNGIEALEKLKTEPHISLILTDINMPEMDGLTLLIKIPEIDQNLKTVVVSAYGDLSNIRTAMNRGAFDFVTKPIDFQDLAITIDKTLNFVQKIRVQQEKLQQALDQLRYQAFHDQLTDLPNQNLILIQIRQCIEQRPKSPFAVLFISLDSFKAIKEGLGHAISEQLLVEMAHRLESHVQSTNTVARVGTYEFAVLLNNIQDFQEAEIKADLLRQALKSPFKVNGSTVSSNIYIGIVNSIINYEQPEDYLRAADTAMSHAKTQGQTSIALFDRSMQDRTLERLQMEAALQNAIEAEELYLNYQPIVSLQTLQVVSLEALVRWRHPQRGLVSPAEFIPLAEETGLIIPLGKLVLSQACQWLSRLQKQFPLFLPITISVNLSGIELKNPTWLKSIDELLKVCSLQGSSLKLEITESILMDYTSAARVLLEQLKSRKIQLSIDDFGTGYSSLSYLQSLPINTLKIDRSFIKNIESNEKNLEITQAIINLAHSLKLDVVAEGVETQEQLDILRLLGCEYGQGYLFSRPIEEQAAADFILDSNS